MKKYNLLNRSDGGKNNLRLLSEKSLLGFFAVLSLTFALFYAFAGDSSEIGAVAAETSSTAAILERSVSMSDAPKTSEAVSDVVSKAQAFKALLSAAQISTLQQTYTTTLARKWSNLPCGSGCRNGIQFSTLSSAQLAAALAVIQAASGTATNEGYDEFNQIRAADDYLNANGGGSGYGSGIYFIAFLNEPTTTGQWMLQFGGHHFAANIAYNAGHVVGATPEFRGVEPVSFVSNGTTYAPLTQEHDALANMLASLTTAQLTTAKLSQTFSDVLLSPGESNGNTNTFPTTKVGVAVSTLTDAQKLLVLEAIKPYTRDLDDTVAANLLTIYQNELNNTYISYTGSGTSGSASSFLNTNTNYVRIDGTSVWVEFIVQTGVVFRSSIHYHTVYRDHTRDYGADLSLTTPLDTTTATTATTKYPFDFDGDHKSDLSVFRASNAYWYLQQSTSGFKSVSWGSSTDTPVPADYDGDGKTDVAVYRAGYWYIIRSSDGVVSAVNFGASGDVPVPGDFDGDGKADIAVFRPSNGTWYRVNSSDSSFAANSWGASGDKPAIGDFDGDGKSDLAVYRPTNGVWYIYYSATSTFSATSFGAAEDLIVPADYDGDKKTDIAVFRPSTANWYRLNSSDSSFAAVNWGVSTDKPVPADYDGDGKADVAVYRDGYWYIVQSSNSAISYGNFGASGDVPLPNVYVR